MSTRKQRERRRLEKIEYMQALHDAKVDEEKKVNLDRMTKAQLIEYAAENDIDIDKTSRKGEILEAIRAVIA